MVLSNSILDDTPPVLQAPSDSNSQSKLGKSEPWQWPSMPYVTHLLFLWAHLPAIYLHLPVHFNHSCQLSSLEQPPWDLCTSFRGCLDHFCPMEPYDSLLHFVWIFVQMQPSRWGLKRWLYWRLGSSFPQQILWSCNIFFSVFHRTHSFL